MAPLPEEERRQIMAQLIAERMVKNTDSFRWRFFWVISDRKPVPLEVHWHSRNTSGVKYTRKEAATARQWVCRALLAGFTVYYSSRRDRWGGGLSLEHSTYSEDAFRLQQELLARGVTPDEM